MLRATGSGIAPIAAILDDAITRPDPREFRCYYGARRQDDLPSMPLLARRTDALGERFQFLPTLSAARGEWAGRSEGHLFYDKFHAAV